MDKKAIIEALREEKKDLIKRIEAIDSAIIGFGEELESTVTAVSNSKLSSTSESVDATTSNDADEQAVRSNYNKYGSWPMKINYALGELKDGGVAEQIVDILVEYEPDIPRNKIFSAVTQHASRMYRQGEIEAERVGRKYLYKLKKEA